MENTNTRYLVVQEVGGRFIPVEIPAENFMAAMELRGFTVSGSSPVGGKLRPQLQGQPTFSSLCGPMWGGFAADGAALVRYEDVRTNDRMSR